MVEIGIYQKMIEEAVSHTKLEAMFAKELDKMQAQIDNQQNNIRTLSGIVTKHVLE